MPKLTPVMRCTPALKDMRAEGATDMSTGLDQTNGGGFFVFVQLCALLGYII
jgi:hypothetical protein